VLWFRASRIVDVPLGSARGPDAGAPDDIVVAVTQLPVARGVPCPRCSGVFPLESLGEGICCPFCGSEFALEPSRLVELESYQASVQAALTAATSHARLTEAWRREATRPFPWTMALAVLAFPVLVVVLPLGASAAIRALSLTNSVAGPLAGLAYVAAIAGWMGLMWLLASSEARGFGEGTSVRVACPSCGASAKLEVGEPIGSCHFCGAALTPSSSVMTRVVEQARDATRAAQLELRQAERQALRQRADRIDFDRIGIYIWLGLPLPILLLSVFANAVRGISTEVMVLSSLTMLNLGVIACVWLRRWFRHRRFAAVLADLVFQFGGRPLSRLAGVLDWLDAHWPSPYDRGHLRSGPYHVVAGIDVCGLPVLVDVDPGSRIHVLVAADMPAALVDGEASVPPAAEPGLAWLHASGFSVKVGPSGLMAVASPDVVRRLCDAPESIHLLSTVVTTLAGVARALSAGQDAPDQRASIEAIHSFHASTAKPPPSASRT
jgi:hypothetical protein